MRRQGFAVMPGVPRGLAALAAPAYLFSSWAYKSTTRWEKLFQHLQIAKLFLVPWP